VNLHRLLLQRQETGRPVTVGVIGAGKFGAMFLAQARLTPGMHVVGVADLDVERAKRQLQVSGWLQEAMAASSLADAHKNGSTHITEDAVALTAFPGIEVIVGSDPWLGAISELISILYYQSGKLDLWFPVENFSLVYWFFPLVLVPLFLRWRRDGFALQMTRAWRSTGSEAGRE